MSAPKPRFFCENCGAEVTRDSERCPKCGRIFASVRCPSCGFTGEEALFRQGCPVCGYCVPSTPGEAAPPWPVQGKRLTPAGKLPPWVYILVGAAACAVGAALFLTLR